MRGRLHTGLTARIPVPSQKASDATFPVTPHPRHFTGRVHPALPTRANHPAYHGFQLHNVNNGPTDDNASSLYDDDRSRTRGANVSPTAGAARGDAMPTGNRGTDSRVLGQVWPAGRGVGHRDCVAGIQLPSRRSEPHWLLLDLPDGARASQGPVRGGRVSGLVRGTVRRTRIGRGGRSPLLVCGTFALATLIWLAILWVVI